MNNVIPWIVLGFILVMVIPVERMLKALLRRHTDPSRRRARQLTRVVGIIGFVLLLIPLIPRLGTPYAVDVTVVGVAIWRIIVDVLLYGKPDGAPPSTNA